MRVSCFSETSTETCLAPMSIYIPSCPRRMEKHGGPHGKCQLILSDFKQKCNVLNFSNNFQYKILLKSIHWFPTSQIQAERYNVANGWILATSRCECAKMCG
jgi:hypothetical protein